MSIYNYRTIKSPQVGNPGQKGGSGIALTEDSLRELMMSDAQKMPEGKKSVRLKAKRSKSERSALEASKRFRAAAVSVSEERRERILTHMVIGKEYHSKEIAGALNLSTRVVSALLGQLHERNLVFVVRREKATPKSGVANIWGKCE